MPEIYFCRF